MRMLVSGRRMSVLMAALLAALIATVLLWVGTGSEVDASTPSQMAICQDKQRCIGYPKGGWDKMRSDKASGGTYHVSRSTTKSAVYLPASGPEIDLVTATGPKRGTAKAFVFDIVTGEKVKVVKFNLRAERSHYKVVKRITGLQKDKLYAVAVVSANGRPVVVDAFKSFLPETPPPPEKKPPSTQPKRVVPPR
jgi:hypothetical protein